MFRNRDVGKDYILKGQSSRSKRKFGTVRSTTLIVTMHSTNIAGFQGLQESNFFHQIFHSDIDISLSKLPLNLFRDGNNWLSLQKIKPFYRMKTEFCTALVEVCAVSDSLQLKVTAL